MDTLHVDWLVGLIREHDVTFIHCMYGELKIFSPSNIILDSAFSREEEQANSRIDSNTF